MGTVTKWAVETAKETMNEGIRVKMMAWDKAHPTKAKKLSREELLKIAFCDTEWQKQVLKRANRGFCEVDIREHSLESMSPLVAAAIKKNAAVDAARNQEREDVNGKLCEMRNTILRSAVIMGGKSADLLAEVTKFCAMKI